jgi:hypothetical protein
MEAAASAASGPPAAAASAAVANRDCLVCLRPSIAHHGGGDEDGIIAVVVVVQAPGEELGAEAAGERSKESEPICLWRERGGGERQRQSDVVVAASASEAFVVHEPDCHGNRNAAHDGSDGSRQGRGVLWDVARLAGTPARASVLTILTVLL